MVTAGSSRFLFVTFEAGGNVPPVLGVAQRLAARGHAVHVLSEPCLHEAIERAGCSFASFREHFTRTDRSQDLLRDSGARTPLGALRAVLANVMFGPSRVVARETLREIEGFGPDVVVADAMLPAALDAAEAAMVARVNLFHMPETLPGPGRPAAGPGFLPRRDAIGRLRDAVGTRLFLREVSRFIGVVDAMRAELGLSPAGTAEGVLSVFHRADLRLVQTTRAFDFPIDPPPRNLRYVGPVLDDPDWIPAWEMPWPREDERPLVVASLSTTFQDQRATLQRILHALGRLDVRGLVTLGPAMTGVSFDVPDGVVAVDGAPHARVFPHAAAVITHAGHGTVMRALTHGLPLLCLPMGRDQDDNAARVVSHGAGLRLRPRSTSRAIAAAVRRLLDEEGFRASARRLGDAIEADVAAGRDVGELEALASRTTRGRAGGS